MLPASSPDNDGKDNKAPVVTKGKKGDTNQRKQEEVDTAIIAWAASMVALNHSNTAPAPSMSTN